MIDRYTLPEMKHIWSDQNKFQKWLDVEIAACEAMAELGQIPAAAVEILKPRQPSAQSVFWKLKK